MTSNSDLTPSQNAGTTENPQNVDGSVGASKGSSFQQSAGVDSLDQNRPISVVQTGKPVNGTVLHGSSLALMWVFIVVASVLLVLIASSVFKWVMKRPEPIKEKAAKELAAEKITKSDTKMVANAVRPTVVRPQGKKKLPRSKRNKS